ncbi:prepilin peptidase [Hellea balneolensis]|uniref:prepilin peptidase n=1 Tax=Hellea balneolensis TaxID=287478 RepID=UPI0006843AF6|nr:A24 family peptidase [Hellea balneolensis]
MTATLVKLKRKGQRKLMMFSHVTILFAALLLTGLALLSWTDIRNYRLPDIYTFPLMGIGLAEGYLSGDLSSRVIGLTLGYAVFVFIEKGFKTLRGKDGLGRGDAKLLAAGGAWCGWVGLPFIVLIASGLGLAAALLPSVRNSAKNGRIPFGPFLALAIFMVWAANIYVQSNG